MRTIHCRHPALADLMKVGNLSSFRHCDAAVSCREVLCNRGAPGWRVLLTAKVWQVVSLGCWLFLRDASSFLEQSWTLCCLRSLRTSARCSAPKESILLVWPSSRLPWPSPCKLCVGRCVWETGHALEFAVARVCREAGARVSTSFERWIWLICVQDRRRIEAEGLPIFHGA